MKMPGKESIQTELNQMMGGGEGFTGQIRKGKSYDMGDKIDEAAQTIVFVSRQG